MRPWRWIPFEYFSAAENMAIDEAIFICVKRGISPPTLRLYGWKTPSVSIGYFQDPAQELNMDTIRKEGYEVVRRPTGGRAIFHEEEITYSVSATIDVHKDFETLSTTFLTISRCFLRALELIGIKAELASLKKGNKGSSLCFSSTSLYEICVNGEKLIGSAQRRDGSSFLQQGSFLIGFDFEKNSKIFPDLYSSKYRHKIGYLKKYISRNLELKVIEEAIVKGFEEELGARLIKSKITDEEKKVAKQLFENKYTKDTWNAKRVKTEFLDFSLQEG